VGCAKVGLPCRSRLKLLGIDLSVPTRLMGAGTFPADDCMTMVSSSADVLRIKDEIGGTEREHENRKEGRRKQRQRKIRYGA